MPYIPHLLQYRFEVGEVQSYRQITSMLMNDPEAGQLIGRVVQDLDYHAFQESEHGGWEIQLTKKLVEAVGPLVDPLPDDLQDRTFVFRMLSDGSPFDLGQGLPGRKPQLPREPVGAGDRWNVVDTLPRGGLPPLTMTYSILVMEEKDGEWQAGLVGLADARQMDGDKEVKVNVESTVTFSVNRGKILATLTKVEMEWPSLTDETQAPRKRRLQTAIDFQERT